MGWTMLVVRLLVALAASALLLMGMIEPGPAAAIGMLGFGLIAPSGGWIRNRHFNGKCLCNQFEGP